jgi:hypothetical protein
MSIFDRMKILVTDHAVYQFALRFHADSPTSRAHLFELRGIIDHEVREALSARRISPRKPSSLYPPDDPSSLYVWTEDEQRVYAIRHDEHPPQFVVTTTMRAERAVSS